MRVRLTKKLAEIVNGLDLSHCDEGDVIDLPARHAQMLVIEGWAEDVVDDALPNSSPLWRPRARDVAADRLALRERDNDDELISRLRMGIKTTE